MGFNLGLAVSAFVRSATLAASAPTIVFPDAVQPGDLCLLLVATNGGPTTAIVNTGGSGTWAALGAQKNGSASWGGRAAMFSHTYAASDTVPTFTTGGTQTTWVMIILRSDTLNAAALLAALHDADAETTTATNASFASFNATTTDLRLAWLVALVAPNATPPTPASSDKNLFQNKFTSLVSIGTNPGIQLWFSGWVDSNTDAGATAWTFTAKSWTRSQSIDDGGPTNGGTCTEEDAVACAVPISATDADASTGGIAVDRGLYGGGAFVF